MQKLKLALLGVILVSGLGVMVVGGGCGSINIPPIPAGVIDCGSVEVTSLILDLGAGVGKCLRQRAEGCDDPDTGGKTACSWKKCLWELAKTTGKAHAVEAVLCAVDQAGYAALTGPAAGAGTSQPTEVQARAKGFIAGVGAQVRQP